MINLAKLIRLPLKATLFALSCLVLTNVRAALEIGPWTGLYKGVEHSMSVNQPGDRFAVLQTVNAIRINLKDPDIQLLSTPKISQYTLGSRETGGLTVSQFLQTNALQIAINANFFDPSEYYLPANTPMDPRGLQISRGVVVSKQESRAEAAMISFTQDNQAKMIHTNWPPVSTNGIYTAITGDVPLLYHGKNVASSGSRNPRTAIGLSQDKQYLYLIAIDGRQPGYSEGSTDKETAEWMLLYGAFDAINLDGGGSTAIVAENSLGKPFLLNRPSSLGDSGRLRTVGSHFGVYAKPMPAFIHDVSAVPDDTQAEVIWTTENAASGQVRFGLTEELDHDSGVDSTLSTKHRMALSELVPDSTYYYQITSVDSGQSYVTPTYSFHTTNYVTSRLLIDLTNSWKYTTTPLKGSLWTKTDYDDSNWSGPEQALLWIDTRATGPNEDVQPKGFNLEGNPDNSSLPYTTYYFRTSVRIDSVASGATLAFSGFIDDGAVFYLNGEEIRRIRMPEAPEVVGNETFALATPCAGDATCLDEFKLLNPKLQPLSPGENVLAVEVHNASPLSRDITFGLTVSLIEPSGTVPLLTGRFDGGQLKLQWSRLGIRLQESEQAVGPWIDVLNSTTFQTYAAETSTRQKFYRLIR